MTPKTIEEWVLTLRIWVHGCPTGARTVLSDDHSLGVIRAIAAIQAPASDRLTELQNFLKALEHAKKEFAAELGNQPAA